MKVKTQVKAGATKCELMTTAEAKSANVCNKNMNTWDIAHLRDGYKIGGPGYGCEIKQIAAGERLGHAICR